MSTAVETPMAPAQTALSQLDQLKQFTVVVADSGDFATLKQYAPRDATTNPSLILKATDKPEYKFILDKAIADGKRSGVGGDKLLQSIMDDLLILFGCEILKVVPGRVSTSRPSRVGTNFNPRICPPAAM